MLPNLNNYHIATGQNPIPNQPGITWLIALNGVFKCGCNANQQIIIQTSLQSIPIPGLVGILPSVSWKGCHQRLPSSWLSLLLNDAQQAARIEHGIARPIEKQYFITTQHTTIRLIPARQTSTIHHIAYEMPSDPVLVDIHSHHGMPAYFSPTDNADDTGLSVSCVIGNIFKNPEIICRLNVYGHHQVVPITTIFDGNGPFIDIAQREEKAYADVDF
ncbi:Mov34/MPN/PAD-1 family protein [Herpetosiphon giganteus]|uniref:Mov34/MPN/PAD-1 family protein n=1 Tax=Herpetosiphon giganteus TaxID=2029754 RepID=UPI00195D9353|nr:Mov34/MPN/PAD-1 family protein [Herpetosiphon giganteus]MBM7843789.1 PRTRC genetic system protein A [Herpetosiphon giganteus]